MYSQYKCYMLKSVEDKMEHREPLRTEAKGQSSSSPTPYSETYPWGRTGTTAQQCLTVPKSSLEGYHDQWCWMLLRYPRESTGLHSSCLSQPEGIFSCLFSRRIPWLMVFKATKKSKSIKGLIAFLVKNICRGNQSHFHSKPRLESSLKLIYIYWGGGVI